jgi:endoglucanase
MSAWLDLAVVKLHRFGWLRAAEYEREQTLLAPVPPLTERCVFGPVLSGGEFTPGPHSIYGHNYGYPGNATIDYYASKNMPMIRLPLLWERVQPVLNGPLDDTEMVRINASVDYAISRKMQVGIDIHNGGYAFGGLIGGEGGIPNSVFADLWGKLAAHYKDRGDDVLLMLMSEPGDQSATSWIGSVNAAIAAIRAAGSTQVIVVPGSYYDGAWTWTISDNSSYVGFGVKDPINRYMFEVHQYLDYNGSGGTPDIVSPTIGASRLVDATVWARRYGMKFFLGEFATASDPASLAALDNMLSFIQQNADVWKYATWWGAGDRWMNYFLQLDPSDYANPVDRPQMAVIQKYNVTS